MNGHKLVIGEGGVILNGGRSHIISGGILTSSVGNIKFTSIGNPTYHIMPISSVISDNGEIKVGLDIVNTSDGYNGIGLTGDKENTFTGDVNISGRVLLDLYKKAGVVSISSNLNVREGALVTIYRSGQIHRGARVVLSSKGSSPSRLRFVGVHEKDIRESFREMVVDGRAELDFEDYQDSSRHGTREIILDDLEVLAGSHLLVKEWLDGRDRLLVRRDSKHVRDSIKRIEFENHDTRTVNLRDYDKDYWEIYAIVPEPGTYGAMLGAAGLGLVLLRGRLHGRRGKRTRHTNCVKVAL